MVPQGNKWIKRRSVPELYADQNDYARLLKDMIDNGGFLIPDPNWLYAGDTSNAPSTYDKKEALEFALSQEGYRKKFSKMNELMGAWLGVYGRPSQVTISKYRSFLERSDLLGLWEANIENSEDGIPMSDGDLGSMMDLNLLFAFSAPSKRPVTRLLEVGGGYGRLAEAAFNVFGHSLKYVLVDAVPASLYYSKQYLTYACPDARIRSFYDEEGGDFNFDDYDISIVPAWHFERLNRSSYDICVNIESMQEMNQEHVDYYVNLFQSVAADEATIYLANARDYYFRGSFNYPKNWQELFCGNTPRSWSSNHPTQIFRKMSRDYSMQNTMCNAVYHYGLWLQSDLDDFARRNGGYKRMFPHVLAALPRRLRSRIQRYLRRTVS